MKGLYAVSNVATKAKEALSTLTFAAYKLAKTSSTPGKTQLINHFIVNEEWYLVDLPGYGFAKTSKSSRAKFETIIFDYCKKRETLVCLFVLIDSRLTLQKIDLEFMLWCAETKIPFSIIYTKTDKNSKSELSRNIKNIEKELLKAWQDMPNSFVTSAEKGVGKEELLEFIAFQINETNTRLKNEKEFKKDNPSIDIN